VGLTINRQKDILDSFTMQVTKVLISLQEYEICVKLLNNYTKRSQT